MVRKPHELWIKAGIISFITLLIELKTAFKISLQKTIFKFPLPIVFFLICLIGPILEEFIFRYLIFKYFDRKAWSAYLFSFLSFILWHVGEGNFSFTTLENFFVPFAYFGIFALLFTFIYKETNWNLFFPILLHGLVNLIGVISMLR